MTAHRNSNHKANRKTRSIQLEQLENRMLCTINGLEQSLLLLNDSLGSSPVAPSVGAANISVQSGNSAPTITTPINSAGNVNTTTSAKSITLSVVATDDGGARALKYNWSVLQSPNGSTARFSRNNNNTASTTVFSYNRVGTYQLQLTVTDGAGLSTTTTQTVTVTPTVTRLELQSPGNTVQSGGRSIRTGGSSANLVAVAYDQFGVVITSPLTYSWRSTAGPSGGTATFTSQGNTATVAFTRSGNYSLEGSVSGFTLRFSVGVSQTLTSIALTPGTASLNSGQTQQFSAVARDQFAQPMAKQPRFTWTATSGTVTSSGLYTAPSASGSATVRATSGTLSGQATVTIAVPAPSNGLQNATLSNLVQTFFADGSITRPEMIQLLRASGNDGSIDATELADLRYVVANANTFNIAEYVKVLASNVVNTNLANGLYQGVAAGNLVAGSSATLLNNLVDKWFLGTDRPTLTNGSLSYRAASGSLFVGAPAYSNEKQGMLGDCYFIAAIGALGVRNPDAVRNMFVDNGDGTYTVRFYGGNYGAFFNSDGTISEGFSNGTGVADYVTVDRMLPSTSSGTFAYSNYGASLTNSGNILWIALAEKAYAQWNATGKSGRTPANTYASIEGGWMSYVNAQVLGVNSTRYASSNAANKQALINALSAGRAVTVGSTGNSTALVSSHAYTITGYDATTDQFTLFNPWGTSHPAPLTWSQIQANTTFFVVGNASQTQPILRSPAGGIASVRSSVQVAAPEFTAAGFVVFAITSSTPSQSTGSPSAVEQIADPTPALNWTANVNDEAIDLSLAALEQVSAEESQSPETDAVEAVDLLFSVDQLDELLNELMA